MKFAEALTAAIDEEYARRLDIHAKLGLDKAGLTPCTRDEVAAGDKDIRIAMDVMGECGLADEFYKEEHLLDFGTFYNCREYGVTVTVGGWTFASFEHRNSDAIMVDGCRVEDVKEYGPYSTDDKWDMLFAANYNEGYKAGKALSAAARYVLDHPKATLADVKAVMEGAVA